MADQEDPSATLPEIDGLPDLNGDDTGLPDLNADDTGLPDLGEQSSDNGLPDLGNEADLSSSEGDSLDLSLEGDLPDLGADAMSDLDDLPELAEADAGLDLSELRDPVGGVDSASDLNQLSTRETPAMAPTQVPTTSGDNVMAFKKIQGIKVKVQVMLGETRLSVSQLTNLKKGEFVQLDTKVGEPVNILANGELIARGEIAVEDEDQPRFGITLTEIIDPSVIAS